ncbi:hypothetical protein SARC_00686, partial [Sphaeroforma arctica JP610]
HKNIPSPNNENSASSCINEHGKRANDNPDPETLTRYEHIVEEITHKNIVFFDAMKRHLDNVKARRNAMGEAKDLVAQENDKQHKHESENKWKRRNYETRSRP